MAKYLKDIDRNSQTTMDEHEAAYLRLGRPNHEQRFQYQRWKARTRKAAEVNNWTFLLDEQAEADRNFGMALDGRKIVFKQWARQSEFSIAAYPTVGNTVHYRNLKLQTGDVLLCNRSRHSDGIFTTLVEGCQSFAHAAVYVLLESDGRKFPAVVEIHHEGVRAVPLKVFLSNCFSTYVEVFRNLKVTPNHQEKMVRESFTLLHELHGFDIDMDESQSVFLSCALTVALLYRRSGLAASWGRSRYSLKTMPNLEILGNTSSAKRDLLMPDDFSKHEDFVIIGTLDNGHFVELVARALVREKMQEIWQTRVLNPRHFPVTYSFFRWAVESVKERRWMLDRMISGLCGLSPGNFPSGPTPFLSLTQIVEPRIERAAKRVLEKLKAQKHQLFEAGPWSELSKRREIQDLVDSAISEFASLF